MWLLFMFISVIVSSCTGTPDPIPGDTCGPGQYKHGSHDLACLECTEGKNFMPENGHKNSQCYNCSEIKDPKLELIDAKCNKTQDTIIVCIPGYYRNTEKETCVECQSCNHTGRQCQDFSDSVCCPGDNYNVVDDVCVIFCSAGEYVSGAECLPCKEGYFNSNQAHKDTNCRKCKVPDQLLHEDIRVPCNNTHDTVIVCEANYFCNGKHEECDKCVNCSVSNQHEGKPCSSESNTVCCPKPGMIVTDSGECAENVATTITTAETTTPGPRTCGKGQYLYISFNDMNTSCLPCRNGTYQDLVNHTEAQCQNCTQYNGTDSQLPETCKAQEKETPEHSSLSGGMIAFVFICVFLCLGIVIFLVWRKCSQRQQYMVNQAGRGCCCCRPVEKKKGKGNINI